MNTIHNPSLTYIELSILVLLYLVKVLNSYKILVKLILPNQITQYCSHLSSNLKHLSIYFTFIIKDFNNFHIVFSDYSLQCTIKIDDILNHHKASTEYHTDNVKFISVPLLSEIFFRENLNYLRQGQRLILE